VCTPRAQHVVPLQQFNERSSRNDAYGSQFIVAITDDATNRYACARTSHAIVCAGAVSSYRRQRTPAIRHNLANGMPMPVFDLNVTNAANDDDRLD
jgi:hypothetical protein